MGIPVVPFSVTLDKVTDTAEPSLRFLSPGSGTLMPQTQGRHFGQVSGLVCRFQNKITVPFSKPKAELGLEGRHGESRGCVAWTCVLSRHVLPLVALFLGLGFLP